MSMRKYGTGEVLKEEETVTKTASADERDSRLADVVKESEQVEKEDE